MGGASRSRSSAEWEARCVGPRPEQHRTLESFGGVFWRDARGLHGVRQRRGCGLERVGGSGRWQATQEAVNFPRHHSANPSKEFVDVTQHNMSGNNTPSLESALRRTVDHV